MLCVWRNGRETAGCDGFSRARYYAAVDECFVFGGSQSNGFIDEFTKLSVANNLYLLIGAVICCFPVVETLEKLAKKSEGRQLAFGVLQAACNGVLLVTSSILLVDATNNPFLYFRF